MREVLGSIPRTAHVLLSVCRLQQTNPSYRRIRAFNLVAGRRAAEIENAERGFLCARMRHEYDKMPPRILVWASRNDLDNVGPIICAANVNYQPAEIHI